MSRTKLTIDEKDLKDVVWLNLNRQITVAEAAGMLGVSVVTFIKEKKLVEFEVLTEHKSEFSELSAPKNIQDGDTGLQVFSYVQSPIRTIVIENEVWWVAKDVCDIFGETNRNRAMQSLDEDEKGYTQMTTPGGSQQISIINESGLYSLLFAMQPEKARGVSDDYISERMEILKKFKRWVTHDVLPSIRKHGCYPPPKTKEQLRLEAKLLRTEALKHRRITDRLLFLEETERERKEKISREVEIANKYTHSYDEADKYCDYDVEYFIWQLHARQRSELMYSPLFGEDRFTDLFFEECDNFRNEIYSQPILKISEK